LLNGWVSNAAHVRSGWFLNGHHLIDFPGWRGWGAISSLLMYYLNVRSAQDYSAKLIVMIAGEINTNKKLSGLFFAAYLC